MGFALQSALRKALVAGNDVSYTKLPSKLQRFVKALDKDISLQLEFRSAEAEFQSIVDQEIVDALILYSEFIKSESKGSGVLLILDELGKFLEYAAMYPERQDIYLLQQLAEAASRSGETPFFRLGGFYIKGLVPTPIVWIRLLNKNGKRLLDDLKKFYLINPLTR